MNPPLPLLRRALAPALLFVVAVAVRLLPSPTVFVGDRVVFFGMDAWYHMRRVLFSLVRGGPPPGFDPYVNFPHGAQPIWSPVFDGGVALLLAPVYAAGNLLAVERAAALLPPVGGGLCVVVTWVLARRLFDGRVALLAGGLLCFLSAHFWYSQVGFLDHHFAVALFATALLAAGCELLRAEGRYVSRWAIATGAIGGGLILLWPGSLLHVGIVWAALAVFGLTRRDREAATSAVRALALSSATAALVALPLGLTSEWSAWSSFSPAVVSRFQPWMFWMLTLQAGACAWLWHRPGGGATPRLRALQWVGIGVALAAASVLVFPDLLAGVAEAWRWFAKKEVFQELVKESKPLFQAEQGLDWTNAELRLSRFVWLFPLALAFLARYARRSPAAPALGLLVSWAALLAIATLVQRRFFNSLAPAFAVTIAWGVVAAFRARPAALRVSRARRAAAAGLSAIACLWLLAPTLGAYRLPALNVLQRAWGLALTVPKAEITRRALLETAVWLRANTPDTAGYHDPAARPEYGVLAPWGYGHLIKYVARRPTVVGNFGDDVGEENLREVDRYFRSREPGAVRILDELGVRYVVVQTLSRSGLEGDAMRRRLSQDDSPGLAHHRLVYESPLGPQRAWVGRSEFRVFEYVAGARVRGRARPGAAVRARLDYESNRGRQGRYESVVRADEQGRYELRLPYATRGSPPGIRPAEAYRLDSAGRRAWLVVGDEQVRSGADIVGPDLSPPS